VGYQKYIHQASRIAQDNTNQDEPDMPDFAGMDDVSEDSEEDNNFDDDLVQKTKYSKFTFSGMSFKDYVNSLEVTLNDEMRKIVEAYIA